MIIKQTCRRCKRETFLLDEESQEGYCLHCERFVRLKALHNPNHRGAPYKIGPGEARILQQLVGVMGLSELARRTGYDRHTLYRYVVKKGEADEAHQRVP